MTSTQLFRFDRRKIERELADRKLLPAFPFKKPGWRADLFESASHFTEEDFKILSSAIRQASNDDKLFVLNYDLHGKRFPSDMPVEWELDLSWEAFDNEVQGSRVGSLGLYLWGPSEKWAVICSYSEYLVYGGEEKFIRYVEDQYGGRELIRERFMKFVDEGGPNVGKEFAGKLIKNIYPDLA